MKSDTMELFLTAKLKLVEQISRSSQAGLIHRSLICELQQW